MHPVALKSNTFDAALEQLLNNLTRLNHYQGFVQWQLKQARGSVTRSLEHFDRKGWERNLFFTFHGLTIINILDNGQSIVRDAVGGRTTKGDEILLMSNEMEGKFNSYMIVYIFEAFEKFLKDIYGKLLYELRGRKGIKKSEFHKRYPKERSRVGTLPYFEGYAHWSCSQNCNPALDLLEKELKLKSIPVRFFGMTPTEYLSAIAFCRNCVVHEYGSPSEARMKRLSVAKRAIVSSLLNKSLHGNESAILPSKMQIGEMFESFASYGWAIYVLLSKRCRMKNRSGYFKMGT